MTDLPFWAFWLAVGLSAGVLIGLAWLSANRYARAAKVLADLARGMAAGEVPSRPQVEQPGHFADLQSALGDIGKQLRDGEELRHQLDVDHAAERAKLGQLLESVMRAGQIATSSMAERDLLQGVVDQIRMLRPRYHVGLYLLEDAERWAILRAEARPEGEGVGVLRRRVAVGDGTIIGQCLAAAEMRAWPGVAEGATDAERAFQAGTRAEFAVPLCSREQVQGAIAVSSDRVEAFGRLFAVALQVTANQTACALENLSLGQRLRAVTGPARASTEQAWRELLRTRGDWGYRYSGGQIERVSATWPAEMREALTAGYRVLGSATRPRGSDVQPSRMLAVPLLVRGQTVGVLGFRKADGAPNWTTQEIEFLELLVGQLGDALVGAQLYEAAQDDAARQQLVGELAGQMRQTLDVEAVLRTAVEEMRQALGLPEVIVRLRASDRAVAKAPVQTR